MSTFQTLILLPLLLSTGLCSPFPPGANPAGRPGRGGNRGPGTSTTVATVVPTPSTPSTAATTPSSAARTNATVPAGAAATAGGISIPAGFSKILFQDDFSTQKAGAQPDSAKWTVDVGTGYPGGATHWGTQEIQTYTKSTENLVITSNGTLKITPIRSGDAWTSARIETTAAQDFSCAAGAKIRIEASLKLANSDPATQSGMWPAFWSMGSAFRANVSDWPRVGELDILEVSNGQSTVFHTAHCGIIGGGPCNEKSGLSSSAAFTRGGFVKLAVEVDRTNSGGNFAGEKITWFVDDQQTKVLTGQQVGDAAAWEELARTPKFILLNVAVGGEFPDAKNNNVQTPNAQSVGGDPSAMEVKYVAVFSS